MPRMSLFYQVGGALPADVPSYVERPADDEIYKDIRAGNYCYVLTTRQMGKSSLMIRTAERLRLESTRVAIVDLSGLGAARDSVTADQWYYGIADTIADDLGLDEELDAWWDQNGKLPPLQRFVRFLRDFVIAKTFGPIVIFVDEIDSSLGMSFASDFFAGIRACCNTRAHDPEFQRLTFVLLGVADPAELIGGHWRTPFNLGRRIELTDFRRDEARLLVKGLGDVSTGRDAALDRVLFWTGGQPYLTQKLCLRAAEASRNGICAGDIDRIVEREFFAPGADRREANLSFVRNRVQNRGPMTAHLLKLYRRVVRNKTVKEDPTSAIQNELKLVGLVRAADDGNLMIRNPIYRRVFGEPWINENWPTSNVGMRVAAIICVLLLVSCGFWYTKVDYQLRESRTENALTRWVSEFGGTSKKTDGKYDVSFVHLRTDGLSGDVVLEGIQDDFADLIRSLLLRGGSLTKNETIKRVAKLTNLTTLDLYGNGLTTLPQEFANLSKLTTIYLGSNNLMTPPPVIANCSKLTTLDLSGNGITALPAEFANLSKLTTLDLSTNKLMTLPPAIANLPNIAKLQLSDNGLTTLPPEIDNLSNLRTLDLRYNKLTTLPPQIGQLSKLLALELRNNELTSLPREIARLSKLTKLELRNNGLTTLPSEIVELSNLTIFDLSGNGLTTLPPEIGRLRNLTTLDLSGNGLTTLPPEIVELFNLRTLDLRGNGLTTIPVGIGKLSNLATLELSGNKLTTLQLEIGKLSNLTTLGVSGNDLKYPPTEVVRAGEKAVLMFLRKHAELEGAKRGAAP
jgi:Leucine-rich repeat (LRR) protein